MQSLARGILAPVLFSSLGNGQAYCMAAMARAFSTPSASNQMALIKSLREKSGAPISDVKSCLASNGWDMEQAYEALRKKGLAAAAKKASRHAAQGLVGLASAPGVAAVVEVNSETDFVSGNDLFRALVGRISQAALSKEVPVLQGGSHELEKEKFLAQRLDSGVSVSDACAEVAGQVRENVQMRRGFRLEAPQHGVLSTYLHQSPAPGLGSIASAVLLVPKDGKPLDEASSSRVSELAGQLAMHVAAMKPRFLDKASIPEQVLEHERALLREQAADSGKPAPVVAKMVEGRLARWAEEACLLEQRFCLDEAGAKVAAVVDRLGKELKRPLALSTFLRVQRGEGLDAAQKDFASEVAEMVNKA